MRSRAAFLTAVTVGTLAVGGCGGASTAGASGTSWGTSVGAGSNGPLNTSLGPEEKLSGVAAILDQVQREVDVDGAG